MPDGAMEKDQFSRYFNAKLKNIKRMAPGIGRERWFPQFQVSVLVSKSDFDDLSSSSSDVSEGPSGDEYSKPHEDDAHEVDLGLSTVMSGPSTHFTSPALAATAMTRHVGSELSKKQLDKSPKSGSAKKSGPASSPKQSPRKKQKHTDAKDGLPEKARASTDTSPILFKYPMELETPQWVQITENQKQAVVDNSGYLSTSLVDFQLLHNISRCPLVLQHTFDVLFLGEVSDEYKTFATMLH